MDNLSSNKDVYRRYVRALSIPDKAARAAELDQVLVPFRAHDLDSIEPGAGLSTLIAFRDAVMAAFSDQTTEIREMVEEGDLVSCRQILEMTHLGPYLGMAPTGLKFTVELMEMVRIQNQRILERWGAFDQTRVTNQIREYAKSHP